MIIALIYAHLSPDQHQAPVEKLSTVSKISHEGFGGFQILVGPENNKASPRGFEPLLPP